MSDQDPHKFTDMSNCIPQQDPYWQVSPFRAEPVPVSYPFTFTSVDPYEARIKSLEAQVQLLNATVTRLLTAPAKKTRTKKTK